MTTMKSLEKRLANIPEPDLARELSEINYRFVKQFSFEQRRALRQAFHDADKAGRKLTPAEYPAALGVSESEVEAKWRAAFHPEPPVNPAAEDGKVTAVNPITKVDTREPATKPMGKRTNKGSPLNDSTSAASKSTASAAPLPKGETDRLFEQFSFEQDYALRQLCNDLAKEGRTIVSRREICAATGISMVELTVKLAKARHPDIAPDTNVPDTSPATELEAKEIETRPKMAKKASQPNRRISGAKAALGAEPPSPSDESALPPLDS